MTEIRTISTALLAVASTATYLVFSLLCYRAGYIFNQQNFVLSALVLLVFSLGALYSFFLLLQIVQEQRSLTTAIKASPGDLSSVENLYQTLPHGWTRALLKQIVATAKPGAAINYRHLAQLLDRRISGGLGFIRYSSNAVLLLGLLGTLLGIVQAVASYKGILGNSSAVTENLRAILAGLDKAFGTSITGIAAALALNFIGTIYANSQRRVRSDIDLFLSTAIVPIFDPLPSDLVAAAVEKSLIKTLPGVVKEVSERLILSSDKLENSMTNALEFSETLKIAAADFSSTVTSMQEQQVRLGSSIARLANNGAEILEVQAKLLDNVKKLEPHASRMETKLEDLLGAVVLMGAPLSKTLSPLSDLPSSLDKLSEALNSLHGQNIQREADNIALTAETRILADAARKFAIEGQRRDIELSGITKETNRLLLTEVSAVKNLEKALLSLQGILSEAIEEIRSSSRSEVTQLVPTNGALSRTPRESFLSRLMDAFRR